MKKSHLSGWLAALSLGVAGVAGATDAVQTGSVNVRTTPVSFTVDEARTSQGALTLFHRIRQAADQVCRNAPHPVGHDRWVQHACEAEAVGEAVQTLNIPSLNEVYGAPSSVPMVVGR